MSGEDSGLKFMEGAAAGSNVVNSYNAARLQRTAAMYNAEAADAMAADAKSRGGTASARQLARTSRAVGRVRAQIAGRGFTTGAGTAGDLEDATDFIGRLDAATIRANARREALGHQLGASGSRLRASSYSPTGAAVGTAIGEASRVHRRWYEE